MDEIIMQAVQSATEQEARVAAENIEIVAAQYETGAAIPLRMIAFDSK